MTHQSKQFFIYLFFFTILSVVVTYYDTFLLNRFDIFTSEDESENISDGISGIKQIIQSYVR